MHGATLHAWSVSAIFHERERNKMLEKQQLIRFLVPGTVLLCLLIGVSLIAWRRMAKSASTAVATHHVEASSNDALKYWTADKMRKAGATNMPRTNAIKPGKKGRRNPSHKSS